MKRGILLAAALALTSPDPGGAQEYSLGAIREAHSFGNPSGAGVESSWVQAIVLSARVPLGESFFIGSRVTHGSMAIRSPSGGLGELSGLADTEVSAGLDLGRFALVGSYWLPTGQTSLSAGASAARGLSSDLFLRYPLVPWGGGGRASIEAVTRFGPRFAGFDLRAGFASHSSFQPLADDPFEYAPGSELFARMGVSVGLSGLTSFRLMVGVRQIGSDQVGAIEVYEQGLWVDAGLAFATQAAMTSVLGTVTYRSRGTGDPLLVGSGEGFRDSDIAFGAWAGPAREALDARVDLRRPFDWGDALLGIGGRLSDHGTDRSSLATVQVGVEREVAVLQAGRLVVRPAFQVGRGTAVVGQGYESSVSYLGGGVTLSWTR